MRKLLPSLTGRDLRDLAEAFRTGRIAPPVSAIGLQQLLSVAIATEASHQLQRLFDDGMSLKAAASVLDYLADDRTQPRIEDLADIVTTGPEAAGAASRDTSVVVREMFASARHSVLVAGYAVYGGRKVFEALAARMRQWPDLCVRLFLDIQRPFGDTTSSSELVRRFAQRLVSTEWPGSVRAPSVYYFARSLEMDAQRRASLHAKCVVVDQATAFVSSANFTEAAHEKNIEIGVLLRSESLATRLTQHMDQLVSAGELQLLPWPEGA